MPSTLGIVASGVEAGFSPLDLPNLVGWWDAADASTITSSGSPLRVSQWDDKSANGNNATQSTSGLQPEYDANESLGGILIGPNNRRLVTPVSSARQPITIFLAIRRTGSASNAFDNASFVLSDNASSFTTWTFFWWDANGTQYVAQRRDSSGGTRVEISPYDLVRHAFTITGTSTTVSLRQDKGTAATSSHTRGFRGTNFAFGTGDGTLPGTAWFHEVIICDAELSQNDQDQVLDYLIAKWSI